MPPLSFRLAGKNRGTPPPGQDRGTHPHPPGEENEWCYTQEDFLVFTYLQVLNEIFRKTPKIQYPGSLEVSGIVDELGPEVTGIKKGDRVAGVFLFLPPNLIRKCSYFCQENISRSEVVFFCFFWADWAFTIDKLFLPNDNNKALVK